MHRLGNGKPIRDAMAASGLSIPKLAARTKEIDPEGKGLSQALIGFYVSTGSSAREHATERTMRLMAEALDSPTEELFGSTTA